MHYDQYHTGCPTIKDTVIDKLKSIIDLTKFHKNETIKKIYSCLH